MFKNLIIDCKKHEMKEKLLTYQTFELKFSTTNPMSFSPNQVHNLIIQGLSFQKKIVEVKKLYKIVQGQAWWPLSLIISMKILKTEIEIVEVKSLLYIFLITSIFPWSSQIPHAPAHYPACIGS
jgi:hypothetical protein